MFDRGRVVFAARGVFAAALVCALPSVSGQLNQARQQGVALVMEADTAVLFREGDRFPLPAVRGELLFPGDRLTAVKGNVSVIRCSGEGRGERIALTAGTILFGRETDDRTAASVGSTAPVSECVLPEAERLPSVAVLEALRGRAAEGVREVETASSELPGKVARAVEQERGGSYEEAAAAYDEIARLWPEQQWARRLALHARSRAPGAPGEGKLYALLLGVSRYQEPARQIRPLRFAHADAELFRGFLQAGGRSADFANLKQVEIRTDEAADWATVRTLLTGFLGRAGRNDTVLLFVASHGITYNQDGYIVLHDSKLQTLYDTGISMKMIRDTVAGAASRARRVFIFIDACHASRIGQIREENTIDRQLRAAIGSVREGEVFSFYAASGDQAAYEDARYGGGHGAFTYFLLRALNLSPRDSDYSDADRDRDGALTADEVINYVLRSVLAATADRQRPYGESRMKQWRLSLERDPYPLPCCNPLLKGGGAVGASRDTVGETARGGDWPDSAGKRRLALEREAQQILLQYIEGDEIPQTKADFARGAAACAEARALAGDSLFLDAREQFFLGRALIFDKRYDLAVEHLLRSIRMDPASPYAYNALGIAYLEQARYDLAEAAFEDSIRRARYWAYPHHNLALTRTQRGDHAGAIATYGEAMRLAPQYSYLPYNLGLLYQRMNRDEEAASEFRRAEQNASWRAAPAIALGVLEMSRGRHARAARDFARARALLEARPEPDLLLTLRHNEGVLLARKRSGLEAARRLWRENIRTGYLPSRFALARALTKWAVDGRRVDAALAAEGAAEWQAIAAETPGHTAARLEWANLLSRSGQREQAARVLEEGLARRPGDPVLLEALGRVKRR